jgi:TnpA family transposase
LPFSEIWGNGALSCCDGQRFAVQHHGLLGALYPRYFGYHDRAITLYTPISDRFGGFATQAISCALCEAGDVLDGLLENDTPLRPQAHTTDTHGFTGQRFGLCHLLGIAFMPRLKDLSDQQFYRLDKGADRRAVAPTRADGGVAAAAHGHVVLQRRIAASPADRVSKALTALGRACKTRFILRSIHEQPTRLAI